MASLTGLLAVSEPGGLWAIIIKSFESGVGSYILAVLLLTILIRVVWAPFDLVNRKFNKKMMRDQAKLQPQMEKLEKQYAKDPQMLNKKKQELYKKANAGLGGGCLFMVLFMALNLTIFGSMFTTMNDFSSYKINQQYESVKYGYANVLNLLDDTRNQDVLKFESILNNYENATITVKDGKIAIQAGETYVECDYTNDFWQYKTEDNKVYDSEIADLIAKYTVNDENEETPYYGEWKTNGGSGVQYSTAIQSIAMKYADELYQNVQKENSFLWISNIWVADSPLKQSGLDYNAYKGAVGGGNVTENEEFIYNSFMTQINQKYSKTNGYFILAILSIATTILSMYISEGISKRKNPQVPKKQNKLMYIIMPLIMGIFAIMYNSVFAFYLVVGQVISTLLSPLINFIIGKWEARDMKKEEQKNVVEYSRKTKV